MFGAEGIVMFPHLSAPIVIGRRQVKNRLFMPAHETGLARRGLPSEEMIAYLRRRAEGGLGLIVVQAAGVHPTAKSWPKLMMADSDECIPGFVALREALAETGVTLIGQLFHPGRLIHGRTVEGMLPVPFGASDAPNEAHALNVRAMRTETVHDVIAGYGAAAGRMARAGLHGVEITAAHGYLPWQFLSAASNDRSDEFGGGLQGRLTFLMRTLEQVRLSIGPELILGLRISVDDGDHESPEPTEIERALEMIDRAGLVDYYSFAFGTENSHMGGNHVIAPMDRPTGYVAGTIGRMKAAVSKPVLAVGRINDPAVAERMIAQGAADMCGSARANLCDPDFAAKAVGGRAEDIRACIACNQACVGHLEIGYPISCIQHPESGRELVHGTRKPAAAPRRVAVVGGGPAGMKAAVIAAGRGHEVELFDEREQLGGQVLLAQALPARAEFGGAATNLGRELELSGAKVHLRPRATPELVAERGFDAVIEATGALPRRPNFEGAELSGVIDAWSVIEGKAKPGARVVVYDWRSDWIGPGVAELLAATGHAVRLVTGAARVGEHLQQYVADMTAGRLHAAGIPVTPYMHLAGFDGDTAYFLHAVTGGPVMMDEVDSIVVCGLHRARDHQDYESLGIDVLRVGDCNAARTVEEAVYEGMLAGEKV